jgi:uncharacterized protein YodC (DUF2158 family)
MAQGKAYTVGTIVKLKSGGPDMTVRRFTNDAGTVVDCQWFAGKKLENGIFPIESLELVPPQPKAP